MPQLYMEQVTDLHIAERPDKFGYYRVHGLVNGFRCSTGLRVVYSIAYATQMLWESSPHKMDKKRGNS